MLVSIFYINNRRIYNVFIQIYVLSKMVAKHLDRQYRNVATKQNKNARIILKSSDKNNRLDCSSISSFFLAFDSLWLTPSFQVECHRIPVTTVFVPILLV